MPPNASITTATDNRTRLCFYLFIHVITTFYEQTFIFHHISGVGLIIAPYLQRQKPISRDTDLPPVTQPGGSRLDLSPISLKHCSLCLTPEPQGTASTLQDSLFWRNGGQALCHHKPTPQGLMDLFLRSIKKTPPKSYGVDKTRYDVWATEMSVEPQKKKKYPWFQLCHIHSVIMLFWSGVFFLFNLHINQNVTRHKSCEILSLPWKYDSWCMTKEIGQIQQKFFQRKLCIFQPIVLTSISTLLNIMLWVKWLLLLVFVKKVSFIYLCLILV